MGSELDLDAALAIARRRTPGEWGILHGVGIGRTSKCEAFHENHGSWTVVFNRAFELSDNDADAIVTAVNNFEAVAERCKRAEQSVEALKAGIIDVQNEYAELERQRDEFRAALVNIAESYASGAGELAADALAASVKGMADGEA